MSYSLLEVGGWSRLQTRLGGPRALAASARHHKAFLRARGVPDPGTLVRLAMMYGPGGQSLRLAAALAEAEGLAELSDVALQNRLKKAADWLEALCQDYLHEVAAELAPEQTGDVLRLIDASVISGPGGKAWRLHLCYAPGKARIVQACLTSMQNGERLDRVPIQAGELRAGDRGYPQPDGLRETRDAGADVLVRLTWNSLHLLDSTHRPLDWQRVFRRAQRDGTLDMPVLVSKSRGRFTPLPLRLVMLRKPPQAAMKARVKARRQNQKDSRHRINPLTLAAADFLILLTSLDTKDFPVHRLGGLYRLRWQVELAFKRLKSLLHMDALRAKHPDLARAWLYAHLLFALLVEEAVAELRVRPP
jgi:Transposase DDE domain